MNVSVNFPAEIENALRLRAAAVGQDVETFVRTVVTESLESRYKRFARSYRSMNPRNFGDTSDVKFLKSTDELPTRSSSPSEFAKRLDSWISLHPALDHAIDDSRESIYSDRD